MSIPVTVNTIQWLDLYRQVAHTGLQFGIEPEIEAGRNCLQENVHIFRYNLLYHSF